MEEIDDLTALVLEYRKTGKNFDRVVHESVIFLFHSLKKWPALDDDMRSEFLCVFYPQIPIVINRFKYRGKPFGWYMLTCIKWRLRSYLAAFRKRKRRTLYFERDPSQNRPYWEDCICAEEPSALTEAAGKALELAGDGMVGPNQRQRVLILAMKNYTRIDTHLAECISVITGYGSTWIYNCIQELKEITRQRSSRLQELRLKRNRCYVRIYDLHINLNLESDTCKRDALFQELCIVKERMARTIVEISRVHRAPTHKDIAAVIGAAKGTVDSGLHYLRNTFHMIYTDNKN